MSTRPSTWRGKQSFAWGAGSGGPMSATQVISALGASATAVLALADEERARHPDMTEDESIIAGLARWQEAMKAEAVDLY